ncbi:NEDD4-binding protein 2-like 1 [Frankliniella fusca]|uniref:NEDD4-binding protein 2-like 1 n=1 Tax=Frankliniella fusca TaxID=407009 RepID=A0AAE1HZV0_9NEOP|nr:NEDD4-binding protein 2-like 1 [Frankliniella fusca]
MNRSRPVGALGGGGWEAGSPPGTSANDQSSNHSQKEKVLADMYDLFLDTLEAGVIACVVESCNFNHKKSFDALIEMAGTSNPTTQSSSSLSREISSTSPTQELRKSSGLPQRNLSAASTQPTYQIESSSLPLNVNGFGRLRNTPGPPTANHYFPARKKKTVENSSAFGIGRLRWYIENEYRIMVLLRGCPGAGKSHLARGLVLSYRGNPKDFIFSTDDYFFKNNVYKFDPRSLSDAHGWNQRRCLNHAREGLSPIFIDNTNTELWEMTVYASIAVNHGYAIVILEPDTPWAENLNELAKRNQHGVPKDKIRQMLERYNRGVTVKGLLDSTGLKYAKPPPQRAEKSLLKLITAEDHGSLRENQTKTTTSISKSTVRNGEHIVRESMASTILPGEFYFGPNVHKNVDLLPSHSANQEVKDERFVSIKAENENVDLVMQKEDSNGNGMDTESIAVENSDMIEREALKVNNSSINEGNCSKADDLEPSIESLEEINSKATFKTQMPLSILEGGGTKYSPENLVSSDESANLKIITPENVCQLDVGSGDGLHSMLESKENSNDYFDLSSHGNHINNAKEETSTRNPNGLITLSSFSKILADVSSRWSESPDRAQREKAAENEPVHNSTPKPPRSFSMKNIQDYCNSVKDMNAASENEASGYSCTENSAVSWQPIESENFHQDTSHSPLHVPCSDQRSKFKKFDVSDKETNTNHADFFFLNNYSFGHQEDGVRVLKTCDRDINEGRVVSSNRVPLKLMLDKSTLTENDYEGEPKSKQEKIKELLRLFPKMSSASIKELLKQCDWDVNYVSNLLLDDTDYATPSLILDENNDADSEVESSSEEEVPADNEADKEDKTVCDNSMSTDIPSSDDILPSRNVKEEAEEVKRHIELSFDFNERCYSPHTLAIKNLRRGKREGAIPKTPSMPLGETEILPVESPPEASDSSDEGNETLEFIIGKDFIQQLVDKFGGSNLRTKDVSPVVKFPLDLARQIYEIIFAASSSEDEEDDGDIAMKLQCEEDERMARQLYEEMLRNNGCAANSSPPQLREIMDMELAQAIYRADVDSLSTNSPDTIANVLAKRLLEENYSHIDKKALHDIFLSCNCSFENTVKTLQEALSPDYPEKERKAAVQQAAAQDRQKNYVGNSQGWDFSERHHSIENSIGIENPWELSDPKAAYNTYREKADEFLKERDLMYCKANEAFKRKERSVAAYYAKLGEVHGKKFQHASAMAAAALAAAQGDSLSTDVLDLHHFKVAEAVTVFDLYMDHHIRKLLEDGLPQKSLDIITGRGQHSLHGKPRIKPAISNRAKKRNLRCQQAPSNPGVLRIWVTSSSYLSHEVPE